MKILLCSTPRSRSSIMIDYLVKKYKLYNFSEKLYVANQTTSNFNSLMEKNNKDKTLFFNKIFQSEINTYFNLKEKFVIKLWGNMLFYTDNNREFFCKNLSSLIPFCSFDKIYVLDRDIYDVCASWFYLRSSNKNDLYYTDDYSNILDRIVLDVLLLYKIENYFIKNKILYEKLTYDEIPNYISEYKYIRQHNNINYSTIIKNYSYFLNAVDSTVLKYKDLENFEFD